MSLLLVGMVLAYAAGLLAGFAAVVLWRSAGRTGSASPYPVSLR